jgi:hypothetical protein
MCLHKSLFSTYQAIGSGVVLMGNVVSCKTIGIGIIRIKMFEGIVRTLIDVMHILELKNNLI